MEKKEINTVIAMYEKKMDRIRISEKAGEQSVLDYMDALQSAITKVIETNGAVLTDIMEKNVSIKTVEHAFNRLVRYTTNAKKMKAERLQKYEALSIDSTFRNVKGDEFGMDSVDWSEERNRHHAEIIQHIKSLLKESDQEIFELYHVRELNQDEIAEKIGKTNHAYVSRRLAVIASKINGAGLRDILDSKMAETVGEITGAKHHVDQSYDDAPSAVTAVDVADYRPTRFNRPTDIQWATGLDIAVPTKVRTTEEQKVLGAIRCSDNGYRRMID